MKRFAVLLLTLLVAAPLTLGILAGISFYGTGEDSLPSPTVTVQGKVLAPVGYDWQEPVFGGMVYRHFYQQAPERGGTVVRLEQPSLAAETPAGYASTARVYYEGEQVWTGRAANLPDYLFLDNGRYELRVECSQSEAEKHGYGSFTFAAAIIVRVEPEMEVAETRVSQGDVLAVRLGNLAPGTAASLECEIGTFPFTQNAQGSMTAYVPIALDRAAGEYPALVKAGDREWELSFTVVATSPPSGISNSAGKPDPETVSEEAYAEFDEKIAPLYGVMEGERYWRGRFEMPVDGGVVTGEYGAMRYVDLRSTGGRSEGVDIAAVTGTAVRAANSGRVVFAESLLNTGNTVVVDHGGGLMSFYYHLDEISAAPGDVVQAGQQLGTLGSTGSATSAHLHFQVRIGGQTISPSLLLNGSGGLYAFD